MLTEDSDEPDGDKPIAVLLDALHTYLERAEK